MLVGYIGSFPPSAAMTPGTPTSQPDWHSHRSLDQVGTGSSGSKNINRLLKKTIRDQPALRAGLMAREVSSEVKGDWSAGKARAR